jgi:hypothetical protein
MLELNNITLVAVTSVNIDAHIKALEYSCRGINFGEVKLLSDITPKNLPSNITHIHIDKLTHPIGENLGGAKNQWNYFLVYKLGSYIDTEYAIIIHHDGFVVNPESWNPDFLNYDYIGSPWFLPSDNFSYRDINGEIIRVGNSVGLRSKKLMDLPSKIDLEWKSFHNYWNEDGFISVNNRHIFIEHGMKFADLNIAKSFSHGCMIPEILEDVKNGVKPFMFHRYDGTNTNYPRF